MTFFVKRIAIALLPVLLMCLCLKASAQSDSIPIFKQHPEVPGFKLMNADSSYFMLKDKVEKKKATVIILFSPTCSHCQHQAEEITSHMKELQDVNFIFSTVHPIDEMKEYINSYGLDKFPNISVGHDSGYILGTFYKVSSLPGIFIYNKKGQLTANFETNVKIDTLLAALNK